MNVLDACWREIVLASITAAGTRGKAFRMNQVTYNAVRILRDLPLLAHGVARPVYGVWVDIDDTLPNGHVALRDSRPGAQADRRVQR